MSHLSSFAVRCFFAVLFFFLLGLVILRFFSGDGEPEIPLNSSGVLVRTGVSRELCSYYWLDEVFDSSSD